MARQTIGGGPLGAVYIDETGTRQTIADGVYIDETVATSSVVETNRNSVFRYSPTNYNINRALFQSSARAEGATVVETNPHFVGRYTSTTYTLNRRLYQSPAEAEGGVVAATNTHFVGKYTATEYRRLPLLRQNEARDFVSAPIVVAAPTHFVGHYTPTVYSRFRYNHSDGEAQVIAPPTGGIASPSLVDPSLRRPARATIHQGERSQDKINFVIRQLAEQSSDAREIVRSNRTYYVRSATGSDGSDGKNTTTAWATLQHAWDSVAALDLQGVQITVNCAGSFTEGVIVSSWWAGVGKVIFLGDISNPDNVTHTATAKSCWNFSFCGAGSVWIRGFRMQAVGTNPDGSSADCMTVQCPLLLQYDSINFASCSANANGTGAATGNHISIIHPGAYVQMIGPLASGGTIYKITGKALAHISIYYGLLQAIGNLTVKVIGNLSFANGFVFAQAGGRLLWSGPPTIGFDVTSATITGTLAVQARQLSLIFTNGTNKFTYFPNSGDGAAVDASSVYI